jgi:hypothetical protein
VTARKSPGFERLDAHRDPGDPRGPAGDVDGKRVLFSQAEQPPTFGSVTIDCSACGERTVVSVLRAARLAVPSVHLPLVRPAPWSYLRCPACRRMSWVRVGVRH